jgi:hypothetical protein
VQVIPGSLSPGPWSSVWERRRPLWPVAAAVALGLLCLLLSGICLLPDGWSRDGIGRGLLWALATVRTFAFEQFASLWGKGLLAPGQAPWSSGVQPGWAMFWDLGFIAAWGYLLARVASRAFSWLAGSRGPSSDLPPWRWLGMAPLLAVGGDVAEDLLTLSAMALHSIGVDSLAHLCLWAAGVGGLAKFGGLLACLPLLVVRIRIAAVEPLPAPPMSRRAAE